MSGIIEIAGAGGDACRLRALDKHMIPNNTQKLYS